MQAEAAAAAQASLAERERQIDDEEEEEEEEEGLAAGDVDAVPADLAGIPPVAEADEEEEVCNSDVIIAVTVA